MTEAEAIERITKFLVSDENFGVDPEDIEPDADFQTDLRLDSLDVFDLGLLVTEGLEGVEFSDADQGKLRTIGAMAKLLAEKTGGA